MMIKVLVKHIILYIFIYDDYGFGQEYDSVIPITNITIQS